jgi:hypothetical protein
MSKKAKTETKKAKTKTKKAKTKMKKPEKNCVYVCDVCGCEIVCTTPGRGPLVCCEEIMYCC